MHKEKAFLGVMLIVASVFAGSCCENDKCTGTAEQNKETVSRALDELYNKGNLQLASEFYADEYIWHNVSGPDVHGFKGMEEHVGAVRQAFPDIHITAEEMIAENDKVVTRWTITGTHKGDLMGIPPTDVHVRFTGILISRLVDGKIVEDWENSDVLGLMQQLGVFPKPDSGS